MAAWSLGARRGARLGALLAMLCAIALTTGCAPLPKSGPRPDAESGSAVRLPSAGGAPATGSTAPAPTGAERPVSGAYSSPATASGARAGADAGGAHDFDSAAVSDALPRVEPRSRYGNKSPYTVFGVDYEVLSDTAGYKESGVASWYGAKFHGARTSSGEPYDMYSMSAAHRTLPLPAYVRVTHLGNGRSVIVRVNDRGPFKHNRVMDLSYAAALKLDIVRTGTGLVEIEAIDPATWSGTPATPAPAPATADPMTTDAAIVIAPLAETPLPTATPTMWVQVGAFGERARAEALRGRLVSNGVGNATLIESATGGRTLVKVRLGPFGEVEALDRVTERLGQLGHADYQLVIE